LPPSRLINYGRAGVSLQVDTEGLDRAVSAYLAGAMDLKLYKREQGRLQTEIRTAEAELRRAEAPDSPYQQLLETALNLHSRRQPTLCGC